MKIIRSSRKTIALVIERDGSLVVRAPKRATRRQIKAVIDAHQQWIEDKQAQMRTKNQNLQPPAFVDGEIFWFLGERIPLSVHDRTPEPLHLNGRFILSQQHAHHARQVFEQWYKIQAKKIIQERVNHWASAHELAYTSLRITSARTRWGSCSTRNSLNFSWRLVLAPLEVIDYVVVHELAHLKVPNHSKEFWQVVQGMLPGYQKSRKWLKENGYRLSLDQVELAS
jgi:predicted metal-dependent hydrolase